MPLITIGSTIIDAPDSGASPNWAPAIIQFMEAVAQQLAITSGAFDVAPQSFSLDAYNTASNIDIPALSFSTSNVRAVFIRYAVYRQTTLANADEAGDIIAVYNPNNSVGFKWTVSQVRTSGGAQISFNMTDNGQIQFSTTALSGASHSGKITFEARALEQT
jgi:hypothetical protein